MTNRSGSMSQFSPPDLLFELDAAQLEEREAHREFVLEHAELLQEVLTGAQLQRGRDIPVACPRATPELLTHRVGDSRQACQYDTIVRQSGYDTPEAGCSCGDPLVESDDPLDTVAAAVLAGPRETPASRFFDLEEREIIAELRSECGSWAEIAAMDGRSLRLKLYRVGSASKISPEDSRRLVSLLDAVEELSYTDGVTLNGFSNVQYGTYADVLASLPGLTRGDAWWLVQTAFDKPVWPADPGVDTLLCSLGVLTPDQIRNGDRRTELEDDLLRRLIPTLFRALAGHAYTAGTDECEADCEIRKFLLTHRLRAQERRNEGPTVVDLFAGAGGLSCGLARAGYCIQWAIDLEPDATATYRLNHPEIPHQNVVCGDICEVELVKRVREVVAEPDVVVGGPPCQSLSLAGYRSRLAADDEYSILDDDRTTLFTQYVEAIDALRPRAIVMENVEGMVNEVGDTGVRVIDWVIEALADLGHDGEGYQFDYRVISMTDLGIPQERDRVILVGIREDVVKDAEGAVATLFEELQFVDPYPLTIRSGLSGLPRLRRGEGGAAVARTSAGRRSLYVTENSLDEGTRLSLNNRAREHPMEKDRILFDEALSPGKTGWDVKYGDDAEYAEYIEYDVGTRENPRFKDKYRMLRWGEPSPTIVAHLAKDANAYVLPDYYEHARSIPEKADSRRNRGLTPREAARLQSFPDDYLFLGSFTSWFRQIGNAVPPLAGARIGQKLSRALQSDTALSADDAELPLAKASSDD